MRTIAAALILGWTAAAQAYMAPQYYIRMRAGADYHVQVRVHQVTLLDEERSSGCAIEGSVARIFRNKPEDLRPWQPVRFTLTCSAEGDRRPPVAGGDAVHRYEALRDAKVLEVHLSRRDDGFVIADRGDKVGYLDATTLAPTVVDKP